MYPIDLLKVRCLSCPLIESDLTDGCADSNAGRQPIPWRHLYGSIECYDHNYTLGGYSDTMERNLKRGRRRW
jgi:hypothetical protein